MTPLGNPSFDFWRSPKFNILPLPRKAEEIIYVLGEQNPGLDFGLRKVKVMNGKKDKSRNMERFNLALELDQKGLRVFSDNHRMVLHLFQDSLKLNHIRKLKSGILI